MNRLFTSFFVFLFCVAVHATNYYIDATMGNDENDGQSPSSAWQSIQHVNEIKFKAGDSVLFKRNETFRGTLIPSSGDEFGYVTYSDYGTGEKPRLLGSISKSDLLDWVDEGNNIWSCGNQDKNLMTTIGAELFSNANLDSGTDSWLMWAEESAGAYASMNYTSQSDEFYAGNGGMKLQCLSGNGNNLADIQLWTENLSIVAGKWYRMSFWAKTTQSFALPSGYVKLIQNGSPYASYSSSVSGELLFSTEWKRFDVYLEANTTAADGRLNLLFGNIIPENSAVYLDSFSFMELEDSPQSILTDVGNVIFNKNENPFCGTKRKAEEDLNSQGDFWYDVANGLVKMYSSENPGSYYSDIELALTSDIIAQNNANYVIYRNLDLRYGSGHGIGGDNTHHILIQDLDFSYIGGGYQLGLNYIRYGNGVEFWNAAHDNVVERCTFNQIYDAALTAQGSVSGSSPYEVYNIYFRNNIIKNSEYSFEFWEDQSVMDKLHDVYFENNTCLYAGYGWGHEQRPDPRGSHLMLWGYSHNLIVRNNIFYESSNFGLLFEYQYTLDNAQIDYNCWFESDGSIANVLGINYDFATQWNDYKSMSKQDTHSLNEDPLFSSEFRLSASSPCIDAGVETPNVLEDADCKIRPQQESFDLGAYEFSGTTSLSELEDVKDFCYLIDHTLYLKNYYDQVFIYDVAGRLLCKTKGNSITLYPGIFVVRTENIMRKILIP